MPDIAGLVAPRPLFVEWGDEDTSRPLQPALDMCREIYTAAGAPEDALASHVFAGGHVFHGGEALPWLRRALLTATDAPQAEA